MNDITEATEFYSQTLDLDATQDKMSLSLKLAGGNTVFIYAKDDHAPATFTVLNFIVDNIDQTVAELKGKGIAFEQLDLGNGAKTDDKDISRGIAANMGPDIAWFKDSAGNTLSVLQEA